MYFLFLERWISMYQLVILDDETDIIDKLATKIDWYCFNIEIVNVTSSAKEALNYIKHNTVDLLIYNLSVNDMDCIEFLHSSKKLNPRLNIISLISSEELNTVRSAMHYFDNYLLKPVKLEHLLQAVKQVTNCLLERENLSKSYEPYLLTFRSTFAEQWVKNMISTKELLQRSELLGINLEKNNYTVVIFSSLFDDILKMSQFYEMMLSAFLGKYTATIYFENPRRFVCILSQIGDQELELKTVIKNAETASSILDFPVFLSIGNTVDTFTNVSESYSHAHRMLFVKYTGFKNFIYQANMNTIQNHIDASLSKFIPLESANEAVLIETVNDLFKRSNHVTIAEALSLLILSNLIEKLDIDILEIPNKFTCLYDLLKNFTSNNSSINDILLFTTTFIKEYKIAITEDQNYYPFVDAVIKSVSDFSDKDISLKTLATKLNMSSSYLGTIFKKQTGFYFNDYLTQERLKYAAELIKTTDIKMKDIVDLVGFSSQTYFNRTFKRYYKVSPLSYRRSNNMDNIN